MNFVDREFVALIAFEELCPTSFTREQRDRAYLVALRDVRNLTATDPATCVLAALATERIRETS